MNKTQLTIMLDYARSLLGVPYIYGGQTDQGCDCSGFVLMCLNVIGMKPKGDLTADGLYRLFKANKKPTPERGELFFYGNEDHISHVAIHLGDGFVIESGGAGKGCDFPSQAFDLSACVRIVRADRRGDFHAACTV